MHGIASDNVIGNIELFEEFLGRRDLVGFFVNLDMRQHQHRVGGKGAQELSGFMVRQGIKATFQRLTVKRQHSCGAGR